MTKLISAITSDGSSTIYSELHGAYYHSLNGALTESKHIFVEAGYKEAIRVRGDVSILEVGFGTGLNAALTAAEASYSGIKTSYMAIEKYPVTDEVIKTLNYGEMLGTEAATLWGKIIRAPWSCEVQISSLFSIAKICTDFILWPAPPNRYNLIYFDAFAPDDQPEMWTQPQFLKLFNSLLEGGILVTFSSKGSVKEALRQSGFTVHRIPGPPGKRHILRACKSAT